MMRLKDKRAFFCMSAIQSSLSFTASRNPRTLSISTRGLLIFDVIVNFGLNGIIILQQLNLNSTFWVSTDFKAIFSFFLLKSFFALVLLPFKFFSYVTPVPKKSGNIRVVISVAVH